MPTLFLTIEIIVGHIDFQLTQNLLGKIIVGHVDFHLIQKI